MLPEHITSHEVYQHEDGKDWVIGVIDTITKSAPVWNGETIDCYSIKLKGGIEVPMDGRDEAVSLEEAFSMFIHLYGPIESRIHTCSNNCKYHMSDEDREEKANG